MDKYFIAIYTHKVKEYCDEKFFSAISGLTYKNKEIFVVDNSRGETYTDRLRSLTNKFNITVNVNHINVEREPFGTLFHRNVTDSVNVLREYFLNGDYDHFVIFESDVIIPSNTIELFDEVKNESDITGGIYYEGFHHPEWFNIDNHELIFPHDQTILSGCTRYSRRLLEQKQFRYDPNYLAPFPDAWMHHDALSLGYKCANYCKIKCKHLPGGNLQ